MNIKLNLPEKFFQGEEICGYYVSPEMKKVWAVELDLIAEFGRVCDKHGLKWWINYGTLLGAVRHKGFIPWDDDVDVVMMREDYEKLCEVYAEEFRHPYLLQSPYNHEYRENVHPYAKLYNEDTALFEPSEAEIFRSGRKIGYSRGIFIDILPLYDLPDNERNYRRMFRKCALMKTLTLNLRTLSDDYGHTDSKKWKRPIMKVLRFLIKLFNTGTPYTKAFDRFMDAIDSYKCPDSKRVIDWWDVKGRYAFSSLKEMPVSVVLRSCFDGTIQLPFEMLTLPAPSGYEELLRHYYGDWHEMKIVPLHGVSYDTEKSYKYYDENGFLPGDGQA